MSETDKTRGISWRMIVLVGSIGLNILLISAIVGAGFKTREIRRGAPMAPANLGPLMRALEGEERIEMRQAIRSYQSQRQEQRARERALEQNFMTAIAAIPFDPDYMRELQSENHAIRRLGAERFDEKWLEIVSAMSDEDRLAYAARLAEILTHRAKDGHKGGARPKP